MLHMLRLVSKANCCDRTVVPNRAMLSDMKEKGSKMCIALRHGMSFDFMMQAAVAMV